MMLLLMNDGYFRGRSKFLCCTGRGQAFFALFPIQTLPAIRYIETGGFVCDMNCNKNKGGSRIFI